MHASPREYVAAIARSSAKITSANNCSSWLSVVALRRASSEADIDTVGLVR